MGRKVVVAGATGLIGLELVKNLLDKGVHDEVVIIVRSKQNYQSKKITQIIESDFEAIQDHSSELNAEDYFCALGTTKAKAGSKEAFEKVDFHYPLLLAKLAKASSRFEQYAIVSAMGADADSIIFYNKVKGKLEQELKKLDLRKLHIFQPNLLIGDREEFRLGELMAIGLSKILSFLLMRPKKPVLAIKVTTVAKAMFNISITSNVSSGTYSPSRIRELAS